MEADQRDAGAGRAALPKAEEELRLASAKETLPLAVKKGRGGDGSLFTKRAKDVHLLQEVLLPPCGCFPQCPTVDF